MPAMNTDSGDGCTQGCGFSGAQACNTCFYSMTVVVRVRDALLDTRAFLGSRAVAATDANLSPNLPVPRPF